MERVSVLGVLGVFYWRRFLVFGVVMKGVGGVGSGVAYSPVVFEVADLESEMVKLGQG